ncbi:metallophosphoesterase [Acetonema longum]|uniref:Metallophosphoesterase n=1 Tax=Acetonema longum DSM 6540 TaxID=1009370 RepID=F7NKU5_9FIRM|nr:metallophosphoesterase [Acetonema longum]EGO63288.1 metallophosphoesterase [Acetonema longum DSM 6540]
MKLFAIADTHLSGNPPLKPMDQFGAQWRSHWKKIKDSWLSKVTDQDAVLLAGDISWAMRLDEALTDLQAIASLPGQKILIRGNHDYWWQTVSKMSLAVNHQLTFLQNGHVALEDIAVCGSRGWTSPADPMFTADDLPIYQRELHRVRLSLNSARQAGFRRILLMLHYPPAYTPSLTGGFMDLIAEYAVETCIFGHLHGEAAQFAPTGTINGTRFHLVACDAVGFELVPINI